MNRLDLKQKFDLIWSEGAVFIIGFEKGLKEFKKHLKPGGFMPDAEKTLDMVSQEIEAYEQFGEFYGYVFYILKH
jgi:SAM-dependent methyltransferase